MRALVLLLAMLSCTALLVACGGAAEVASPTIPAEFAGRVNPLGASAASAGAGLFATNCASCHGPEGRGDGPASAALRPAPTNLAAIGQAAADDVLFWRIRSGVPGTAMPAWRGILSDEQIWQIVAFIRSLK